MCSIEEIDCASCFCQWRECFAQSAFSALPWPPVLIFLWSAFYLQHCNLTTAKRQCLSSKWGLRRCLTFGSTTIPMCLLASDTELHSLCSSSNLFDFESAYFQRVQSCFRELRAYHQERVASYLKLKSVASRCIKSVLEGAAGKQGSSHQERVGS